MKLSTIVSELLTDFRLKDILKSGLLKITALLILAAWVVPAAFDSYLHPDRTFFVQLFNPTTLDIYLRSSISILFGGLGLLTILGFNRIDKQHQDLMFERAKLSQIIESGPQCIKTVAKDGSLIEMNPAGLMMIEAESLDLVQGQSVYNLIAEEDRDAYIDFNKRIFDGHSEVTTYDIVGLEGTRKRVESHAVPLFDDNGQVRAHLAMTRDITQSHKLAEELSYQASHDMLTGLINRQEFERRLENTLTLAITDQSHHAIFFIDLDQFKLVNDTCGHMAGDELLRQVAAIMTHQVRQQDSVARMGGDEFAILLQYCCLDEARNIAEKLRQEVEAFIFPWEDRQFKVSTSIGIVGIDEYDNSVGVILRDADTACYLAKEMGRNRVHLHQEDDDETDRHVNEMQWVSRVHEGIEKQSFELYAQLIENLSDSESDKHAELLLRYRNEDESLSPPGAFLPATERYGVSPKLDRHVITTTLSVLESNPILLQYVDLFSINLSGLSLGDDEFLQFVKEQFQKHPTLPGKICFEITETAAIGNLNNAMRFIQALKDIGCRFSLDDFGSGLSSFGYLKSLPVDYLKIDGSFVKNIVNDAIDLAMVRSINDIGHLMNKKTIAEYVENDAIREKLKELNINYAQGYGIAKPIPMSDLIDLAEQQLKQAV